MTPNEHMVLDDALNTLSNIQIDTHVYRHTGNSDVHTLYDYAAIGKHALALRMLSELLGRTFSFLLPGEYCDEDTTLKDLRVYTPIPRSEHGAPLTDSEKRWLIEVVLVVMGGIGGVTDSDDACLRVTRRKIAEVARYPDLRNYRLMMEDEVTPKFFIEDNAVIGTTGDK